MFRGFPYLTLGTNFIETSPASKLYNCIAWTAEDDSRWWWPHPYSYWPPNVAMEETREAFVEAYGTIGFEECADGSLEAGFEKIALYGTADGPKHAARQLSDGSWTSKLGPFEDITHQTLESLNDHGLTPYGHVVAFLRRQKT